MTAAKNRTNLSLLIAEAIKLAHRIRRYESRLLEIKEALKADAYTRQEEHAPTSDGGWSCTTQPPAPLQRRLQ